MVGEPIEKHALGGAGYGVLELVQPRAENRAVEQQLLAIGAKMALKWSQVGEPLRTMRRGP